MKLALIGWMDRWKLDIGDELQLQFWTFWAWKAEAVQDLDWLGELQEQEPEGGDQRAVLWLPVQCLLAAGQRWELEDWAVLSGGPFFTWRNLAFLLYGNFFCIAFANFETTLRQEGMYLMSKSWTPQPCRPKGPPPANPSNITVDGGVTWMDVHWDEVSLKCPDLVYQVLCLSFLSLLRSQPWQWPPGVDQRVSNGVHQGGDGSNAQVSIDGSYNIFMRSKCLWQNSQPPGGSPTSTCRCRDSSPACTTSPWGLWTTMDKVLDSSPMSPMRHLRWENFTIGLLYSDGWIFRWSLQICWSH